jgi:L-ascorbate metabolism protein UlaG (beta-lactamase superfamily)
MELAQAKITYLAHSGFSVETANHFFLFDYCPSMDRVPQITADFLRAKENVVVFVSHSHGDHFDAAILKWAETNPAITYVFSSDIHVKGGKQKCHFMNPYEQWEDGQLEVRTFGSTDAGVSFWLRADGLTIFHAGDLNWWRWSGETQAEQDFADRFFIEEMEKLPSEQIDIAFFPVDRRLEENYALGAEYFAKKMQPKLLAPMHFGADFAATKAFREKVAGTGLATVEISRKGQVFFFP